MITFRGLRDADPAEHPVSMEELSSETATLLLRENRRIERQKLEAALGEKSVHLRREDIRIWPQRDLIFPVRGQRQHGRSDQGTKAENRRRGAVHEV
jgi:hypothetical protein